MTATTILIIEDHSVNAELLTSMLEAHGFAPLLAQTAMTGVEMARSSIPSLILMDLSLPGMNGLDAVRLLKADIRTAAIPVIAVTAHALPKFKAAAMAVGCSAFVTKPIDPNALMLEINRTIAGSSSGQSGVIGQCS